MGTPEFDKSRDERKRVEMRFAHLKTHHRFERMRLQGLSGARDEFHLAAIVQNLKTLANHLWRPPPNVRQTAYVISVRLNEASIRGLGPPGRGIRLNAAVKCSNGNPYVSHRRLFQHHRP